MIRAHPAVGESLLGRILSIGEVLQAVLHHHERWDGLGYPRHLGGEDIPLLARMLAVAEVFDALISERPYRGAYEVDRAYDLLRDSASYELDPNLVDKFIEAHSGQAVAAMGNH